MRPKRTTPCSIPECQNLARRRGWCPRHYSRWARHGDPVALAPAGTPASIRFWRKVTLGDPPTHRPEIGHCWLWSGSTNPKGYGSFYLASKTVIQAHHFLAGKANKGLQWDHLCNQPSCVRPSHLEMVDHAENERRKKLYREAMQIKQVGSPAPTCCTPEEAREWADLLVDDPRLHASALRHLAEVEVAYR